MLQPAVYQQPMIQAYPEVRGAHMHGDGAHDLFHAAQTAFAVLCEMLLLQPDVLYPESLTVAHE